jgi:formylglycine-generating enzyme required for sulfatase activity
MHGNIWQWVQDWYMADYKTPNSFNVKVSRGGSFFNTPALARSAARNGADPQSASPTVGFRLARTKKNQ